MPKLVRKCPTEGCGKIAEEVSFAQLGSTRLSTLKCGHIITSSGIEVTESVDFRSLSGKQLFPHQLKGIEQGEAAGGRVLFAWEQRTGKTPLTVALTNKHTDTLLPMLISCKARLKRQWFHEIVDWSRGEILPQTIDNPKDFIFPGLKAYIISDSLLTNVPWLKDKLPFIKTVVIDECQRISHQGTKRTQAIREFCRDKPHVIGLSGTPIENNAAEFFVMLNLLHPERFPSYDRYVKRYVSVHSINQGKGKVSYKYGGIDRFALDDFRNKTKDFIFRVTREEVLPDLPKIFRSSQFHDLDVEARTQYEKQQEELQEILDTKGYNSTTSASILGYLARMRSLTGLSKIGPAVDFGQDHLVMTDRKLTIAYRHEAVGAVIHKQLSEICEKGGFNKPLFLRPQENPNTLRKMEDCMAKTGWVSYDQKDRLCIASIEMAAEGYNLYQCSDSLVTEQLWNPKKEEQWEARHVGKDSTADRIDCTYLIIENTVDEMLAEYKERKRQNVAQTLGDKGYDIPWEETDVIREMLERIQKKGRKGRWRPTT